MFDAPFIQKLLNSIPVKYFAPSEVMDLEIPKRAKSSCIFKITVAAVHELTSNTSNHVDIASITTKKLLFL